MFSLESPQRGDSNKYTQYTISQYKKENLPKLSQICNYGICSKGLKYEFETAVVNEPSVFEPLKFYCICRASTNNIQRTKTFTPLTLFTEFTPLTLFTEFCLFIHVIVSMETGPLYNIKTIADIFTRLGSNIKHFQLMFREYKVLL